MGANGKLEFIFYGVFFRQSFIDLQGDLNAGGMLSDGVKWLLVLIPWQRHTQTRAPLPLPPCQQHTPPLI